MANDMNNVVISGEVKRVKCGTSDKGAWGFVTLSVRNQYKDKEYKQSVKCNAFGTVAEALALAKEGDCLVVSGGLVNKKSKAQDGTEVWEMMVDIRQLQFVQVQEPDAAIGNPPERATKETQEDMPF